MSATNAMRIDGSYGEGGGQILRTALALSAITGRPLELFDIRKGRKHPGLGNQHLACVRAMAKISHAHVEGDRLGSGTLHFSPTAIHPGTLECDVAEERGSAGSVTLILQALLPALCVARQPSHLVLRGGTHVPWSPPVHYVQNVLLPMLKPVGIEATLELIKAGWYPKGGGEIRVTVHPATSLMAQRWLARGALQRISGWSLVSNLPHAIAERQRTTILEALHRKRLEATIECVELPSPGTGTCVVLVAEFEHTRAGFAALGERGKSAEQVGQEAAQALHAFLETGAALEEHLADQVVVLLALAASLPRTNVSVPRAGDAMFESSMRKRDDDSPSEALVRGRSQFTTSKVTRHLLTNLWTIQQCLPIRATLEGREGEPGRVAIEPA